MSATKPEKCPRCGCVEIADSKIGTHFACHTLRFSDDGIVQSLMCTANQRDQLAEEVRRLKAEIADRNEAAACAVIQGESVWTRSSCVAVQGLETGANAKPSDADLREAFDGVVEPVGANTIRVPPHVAKMLKEMDGKVSNERRDG